MPCDVLPPEQRPTLCWVLPDMGFYHHARIEAAARRGMMRIVVVELSDRSEFPEFRSPQAETANYERITLFNHRHHRNLRPVELDRAVSSTLDRVQPDVLLVQGWSEPVALAPLGWATRHRRPCVVASETQAHDFRRRPWTEWVKRRVVGHFAAGLVGGRTHADYLADLGISRDRICLGYDVVDNQHFADGADAARRNATELRRRFDLPDRYFLASARFVSKKNLQRLLTSYAAYARQQESQAWKLVLLGDGPERPALEHLVIRLQLEDHVQMPGFRGYHDLPAYYGLASAFVHASQTEQWGLVVNEAMAAGLPVLVSNRCGCCWELVHNGHNGFSFDPQDDHALTQLFARLAGGDVNLAELGQESRRLISDWSPERFADGLQAAAEAALTRGAPRTLPPATGLLLRAVARRRGQHV